MGIAIVAIGNAAAAALTNDAAAAQSRAWWAGAGFPDWGLFVVAVLIFAVAIAIARGLWTLVERFPERKKEHAHFTRMLCDQLWRHTDFITNTFAERMRQDPNDTITLHVLIRNLREDLAAPAYFVDQMLNHPPAEWPDYPLFSAFTDWAGRIKSMASQLADVQQALVFPPGKEAPDKYREQMLVYKFLTERTVLSRGVSQLRSDAFTLCAAAKKSLEKAKKNHAFGIGHNDDEDYTACPCCNHSHEHIQIQQPDHLHLAPLPIPPKAPEKPATPATKPCCCAVPVACHCVRACACVCQCAQTPAPVPTH